MNLRCYTSRERTPTWVNKFSPNSKMARQDKSTSLVISLAATLGMKSGLRDYNLITTTAAIYMAIELTFCVMAPSSQLIRVRSGEFTSGRSSKMHTWESPHAHFAIAHA